MQNLSRREFIIAAGAATMAAASVRSQSRRRVLVLGAGLSGLSAAYELAIKGFDVTVLEARNRVGGRVFTLRSPFSNGLYTETGGELFGDGYKRFLAYADKFKLNYGELRAEAETGGALSEIQDGIGQSAYLKGRFFRQGEKLVNHPYKLTGDEASMLPPTLLGKHIRLISNEIQQQKTSLEALDSLSLGAALRARGVSKTAVKLIDISLNYNSVETASAAGVLNDGLKGGEAGTVPLKIEGGNDRLPAALSEAAVESGVKIELNKRVTRIISTDTGVRVHVATADGPAKAYDADILVCTIPFSVLRGIKFEPELPKAKALAVNTLDYTRNTKVFLEADYAEFDKRSLGSSIWTDTSIERIFSTTGKPGDSLGLFTIWTEGNGSKKLQKMNANTRQSFAAKEFERILPFMKGSVRKTETLSWSTDPFALGAYSHLRVGQFTGIGPEIHKPVGRIHFAGEHTAIESPGMEGALESAERVVKEIAGD